MAVEIRDVLVFTCGSVRFAIPIRLTQKVIQAQEITPVSSSLKQVVGVIDYHGEIIPVISLREYFQQPAKELEPSDRFIIIDNLRIKIALVADDTEDIVSFSKDQIKEVKTVFQGLSLFKLVNSNKGIVYIYDPESVFSRTELADLEKLTKKGA